MLRSIHLVSLVGLALAACGGSSGDISGTGIFKLAITDAPIDNADAVVVTISEVHLRSADDSEDVESFVFDPPRVFDLLALQGGLSEILVNEQRVPVGSYAGLRLVVDSPDGSCNSLVAPFSSYITIDGTDYPLVVPSGGQSGLKVNGPVVVQSDSVAAYTIDFDLRKSVAQRGNTGCYNLRPTLRLVSDEVVGVLGGRVSRDLLSREICTANGQTGAGAAIYVYQGMDAEVGDSGSPSEPLASALLKPRSDATGDFDYQVSFLPSGNYTAAFTCQAGDDAPDSEDNILLEGATNILITAGNEAELNFTLQLVER